jgi:hypothetical protein
VIYAAYPDSETALETMRFLGQQGRTALLLSASTAVRESRTLASAAPSDLAVMEKVKAHFDPRGLVNQGRMHGWF